MGKQYFCDELNDVLSCFHDRIMSCCSGHIGPVYYEAYRGQKIDWEAFKKIKQEAFDLLTEENIDKSPCKGCFFLRERKQTDVVSPTFKTLNVSHWTQCNCGCVYCARMSDSKGEITLKSGKSQYYDFVPLLKELFIIVIAFNKSFSRSFKSNLFSDIKNKSSVKKPKSPENIT